MSNETKQAIDAIRSSADYHLLAALIVRDVMGHLIGTDLHDARIVAGYEVLGTCLPHMWPDADEASVAHAFTHGRYSFVAGNVAGVPTAAEVAHAVAVARRAARGESASMTGRHARHEVSA